MVEVAAMTMRELLMVAAGLGRICNIYFFLYYFFWRGEVILFVCEEFC